jgi:hypothetical protein
MGDLKEKLPFAPGYAAAAGDASKPHGAAAVRSSVSATAAARPYVFITRHS